MPRKIDLVAALALACLRLCARADSAAGMAAYQAHDYERAQAELLPEARAGDLVALNVLGVMSMNGQGGPRDDAAALDWFLRAAAAGYAPAQTNAGFMYQQGRGALRDPPMARYWYDSAASHGDARAHALLVALGPAVPAVAECVPFERTTRATPPNDLYASVARCIASADFANAVHLFLLAGISTRFDALRVADETARDTGTVLIMNTFNALPADDRKRFGVELKPWMDDDALRQSFCAELRRRGPPSYFPAYMVLHGLYRPKPPLLADFDAAQAWSSLQVSYLHCKP